MALSWGKRRRFLYTAVFGVIGLVVLVLLYQTFFAVAPTCFDGVQNGSEHGVDCGGNSCSLLCRSESHAPVVLWSRIFQTSPTTYTVAAYVENDNPGAGAKNVGYSFQIFDADNNLIVERDGTTDLPPVQNIPIIEVNVPIQNRVPTRVLFGFSGIPTWNKISNIPTLKVTGQSLSADASRLEATLVNDSLQSANNVTIGAVLFDASGTAKAASKSRVNVTKKSSTPVVFTFPGAPAGVVRAEITVLPSF